MTGFRSCKTGIHAHNLDTAGHKGTAAQARVQSYRSSILVPTSFYLLPPCSRALAPYLRPVGNIDMETCRRCGGSVKVLACIDDPVVIKKILTPLQDQVIPGPTGLLAEIRAPPAGLFG